MIKVLCDLETPPTLNNCKFCIANPDYIYHFIFSCNRYPSESKNRAVLYSQFPDAILFYKTSLMVFFFKFKLMYEFKNKLIKKNYCNELI